MVYTRYSYKRHETSTARRFSLRRRRGKWEEPSYLSLWSLNGLGEELVEVQVSPGQPRMRMSQKQRLPLLSQPLSSQSLLHLVCFYLQIVFPGTAKMCGHLVATATALLVALLCCWMVLPVDGSIESDTKEIQAMCRKYLEGGIAKGDACMQSHTPGLSYNTERISNFVGKDAGQIAKMFPPGDGSSTEIQVKEAAIEFRRIEETIGWMCKLKEGLVCSKGTCAVCSGVASPDEGICRYCHFLNIIAKAGYANDGVGKKNPACKDSYPGLGQEEGHRPVITISRGGKVCPLNAAVFAGLVFAVFSLSQ